MNYLLLFNVFTTFVIYQCYHIKVNQNIQNIKLCINCSNYKKIKNLPEELGVCKLFSPEVNLITGKNLYYPAMVARKIENLCGDAGKYYSNKT